MFVAVLGLASPFKPVMDTNYYYSRLVTINIILKTKFSNALSLGISFISLSFFYAAVERNNLMRLSQSIPFTPVPPRGKTKSKIKRRNK